MPTTTNFGWTTPADTDLVKDGAAAIRTALGGVDTSFIDLKGGTTGQVLSKATGTDLDFTWISAPAATSWSLLNAGGTALTGATTITISGISGKGKILILVSGGSSANGSSDLGVRFNADSTNANYQWNGTRFTNGSSFSQTAVSTTNGGGDPYFKFAVFSDNAASASHGYLLMDGANSAGLKIVNGAFSASAGGGTNQRQEVIGGYYAGTSTISSVSLISSSGNWDAGTVFVYASA